MTLLPLCDDQQENKRSGLPYPFLATQAHRAAPIRSSQCASAVAPPGRSSLCASAAAPPAPCNHRRPSGPLQARTLLRALLSAPPPLPPAGPPWIERLQGSPASRRGFLWRRAAGCLGRPPRHRPPVPRPAPGAGRRGALAGPLGAGRRCLGHSPPAADSICRSVRANAPESAARFTAPTRAPPARTLSSSSRSARPRTSSYLREATGSLDATESTCASARPTQESPAGDPGSMRGSVGASAGVCGGGAGASAERNMKKREMKACVASSMSRRSTVCAAVGAGGIRGGRVCPGR